MSPDQILVADLVALALATCLVGLIVRGRLRVAPWFATYLVFTLATNRAITWWPDVFFNRSFWYWKNAVSSMLDVAIVLEISAAAFRRWPLARHLVLGAVAVAGLAAVGGSILTLYGSGAQDVSLAVWASVQAAATWAFVAVLAVATWYRLPLHPFHRAICLGFALGIGLYGLVIDLVARGFYRPHLVALGPAVYAATVALWAAAAWRKETAGEPVVQALYPWAAR